MISRTKEIRGGLGVRLRIQTDTLDGPDPAFDILAGAYVPEAVVVPASWEKQPDGVISHSESSARFARVEPEAVTIGDAWNGSIGFDAYHLLYAMARFAWLKGGVYPAHAACVETQPGFGVLLAGASGAGKTAVAMRLLRHPGCLLVSGNKTLISFNDNRMTAMGGTRVVTADVGDILKLPANPEEIITYGSRFAARLPADLLGPRECKVNRIIFPKLRDDKRNVMKVPTDRAVHMLYPVMLDAVNANVVLAGGASLYPDYSSSGVRQTLALLLANTLGQIEVTEVSGDADYIAEVARS